MKILVTGANGFVGKFLCDELFQQGFSVRAGGRSANSAIATVETVIIGAIDSETDWSNALQDIDVVIHLAARVHVMADDAVDPLEVYRKVNTLGTLNLAQQAVEQGVKRFIFLSSIKVNGEHTELDKPFNENDIPNPQDNYGLSKYEAEQGLFLIAQKTEMDIVVIRPPLIYGSGVKANFARMMNVVKRGIPLPFGAIYNKRSVVYMGNLVSLILRCIDHPAAANQVFLVSDGCDISTTELLRACATALGVKARLLPMPQTWIESGASLLGKQAIVQRLCGSLQVDITKAKQHLGWSPPFQLAEGLKLTTLGISSGLNSK
jgi:nucleoside-diphosphate-sugar epimerase